MFPGINISRILNSLKVGFRTKEGGNIKIVTICLLGRTNVEKRMNDIKTLLNDGIIKSIRPNVAIFPGGTLVLRDIRLFNYKSSERIKLIEKSGIVSPLKKLSKNMGMDIILGIDTLKAKDQCVCHINKDGIKCITRKIFPVSGGEADSWVSNVEDASKESRVTRINGCSFLLAACYDMYGAEILTAANSKRLRNIQRIAKNGEVVSKKDKEKFKTFKDELVSNWSKSVLSSDIGVACIHAFTKNGEGSGIGYWQRDGIEKQFHFFKMKKVFGAAHYIDGRQFPKNLSNSLLANGSGIKKIYIKSHIILNGKALVREWSI